MRPWCPLATVTKFIVAPLAVLAVAFAFILPLAGVGGPSAPVRVLSCTRHVTGRPSNVGFSAHIKEDSCDNAIRGSAHCAIHPALFQWFHGPVKTRANKSSWVNCGVNFGINRWGYDWYDHEHKPKPGWVYKQLGHT